MASGADTSRCILESLRYFYLGMYISVDVHVTMVLPNNI